MLTEDKDLNTHPQGEKAPRLALRHRAAVSVRKHFKRVVCSVFAIALSLGTAFSAFSQSAWGEGAYSQKGDAQQVDNSYLFNEGFYLNQKANWQDPPFRASDITCEGGHLVRTKATDDINGSCYEDNLIWTTLTGESTQSEGWAFVCDNTSEQAAGARVSMTYRNIGEMRNAADASYSVPVDVKVTYQIAKGSLENSHYYAHFDGHPVIQFTDNFSFGTFLFGVVELNTTYEFFNSNTGEQMKMDSLYVTHTSCDKGEGMAVLQSRVKSLDGKPGVFLSSAAPDLKTNPLVNEQSRWSSIPGTYMYNTSGDYRGYYAYQGVPPVLDTGGRRGVTPPEYRDTIGDPTYYWRAVCYLVDMANSNSITLNRIANGWNDWHKKFGDGNDTTGYDNGGNMYFTTNFLPLTNPRPQPPAKSIDKTSGVGLGDEVTYTVSQEVVNLGYNGMAKYTSMVFTDPLPKYVEYVDGSAKFIDPTGADVTAEAGTVDYDKGQNKVTFTLSSNFLQNGMKYTGGDYKFTIKAKVVEQPENDVDKVTNTADVTINGETQTTNEVSYEPIHPKLKVEKHADTSNALASAIAGFEYLSHDQHPDRFSTVHYVGQVTNTVDRTCAQKVVVEDDLPRATEGKEPGEKQLHLVPGSLKAYRIDPGTGVHDAEGISVSEDTANDKIKIEISHLRDVATADDVVYFEYDCYTDDAGNGQEVVNTVTASSPTVQPAGPGSIEAPAADDGEIYINDPDVKVTKKVSESPVQNDDYQGDAHQQKEEYRVDDTWTYTVTVENTAPGTFAHNVVITDDDMPNGLELASDIVVSGLDRNGRHLEIFYPMQGVNDTIHDEGETREINWNIRQVENAERGTWGWMLNLDYLTSDYPVTVTWSVKATEEVNGWEIYNQAKATAENQPGDEFKSETPIVWVNSPRFDIDKQVRKTDKAHQVGDVASYDVELFDLLTPGTLARKTTLEDRFQTEGTTIVENSFVITDKQEEADDIRDGVELNRHVGDQHWHVDMTQVYSDETGYWVCDEDWRPVWKDGALSQVASEHNPVKVDRHSYFHVHYEATINDMALQNLFIDNTATADSEEQLPVEDTETVTVIGAQLSIEKTSVDDGTFDVGETAQYRLTVTNMATGTVANDVQIKDSFTTAKAGAAEIVDGTLSIHDKNGREIKGWTVEWTDNEAGNHIGFAIDTNYDLSSDGRLEVTYDVKYLTNNGSSKIVNVAHAWAENAPDVQDDYETWPTDADQSDLVIQKGSDRDQYKAADVGEYTLHVTNENMDTPARNVVVHDEITVDDLGVASIVKGSVRIFDEEGNAVSAHVVYNETASGRIYGFTAETGRDLSSDEYLEVHYQVRFADDVAQESIVHNEAWTASDNTGQAHDDNDVVVAPGTRPDPDEPADPVDPENPETISLDKSVDRKYVDLGESATYTLTLTVGDEAVKAASIQDVLPEGLVLDIDTVKVTVDGVSYEAAEVSIEDNETGESNVLNVALGDLDANAVVVVTYTAKVTDDTSLEGSTLVNVATAEAQDVPEVQDDAEVHVNGPSETTDQGNTSQMPTTQSPQGKGYGKTGDWLIENGWMVGLGAVLALGLISFGLFKLWQRRKKGV